MGGKLLYCSSQEVTLTPSGRSCTSRSLRRTGFRARPSLACVVGRHLSRTIPPSRLLRVNADRVAHAVVSGADDDVVRRHALLHPVDQRKANVRPTRAAHSAAQMASSQKRVVGKGSASSLVANVSHSTADPLHAQRHGRALRRFRNCGEDRPSGICLGWHHPWRNASGRKRAIAEVAPAGEFMSVMAVVGAQGVA